ncbi:MAG: Beta-galactosidase C-terminal domain [Propionibacteriales bacterium]|nr:Beta-galactosidase C-terminal domain [Propionibacteriales bacterium]
MTRATGSERFTFVINHAEQARRMGVTGTNLLTGTATAMDDHLPAGAVAVIRQAQGDD